MSENNPRNSGERKAAFIDRYLLRSLGATGCALTLTLGAALMAQHTREDQSKTTTPNRDISNEVLPHGTEHYGKQQVTVLLPGTLVRDQANNRSGGFIVQPGQAIRIDRPLYAKVGSSDNPHTWMRVGTTFTGEAVPAGEVSGWVDLGTDTYPQTSTIKRYAYADADPNSTYRFVAYEPHNILAAPSDAPGEPRYIGHTQVLTLEAMNTQATAEQLRPL